jgi:hypothetical protein
MIHVVTVITEDYLPRADGFLYSLRRLKDCRRWCFTLGWEAPPALAASYFSVTFLPLPRHDSDSFGMCQSGRAAAALPEVGRNDTVIQVDADVVVQRNFTAQERGRLAAYDNGILGAAPNAGPGDNLWDESARIHLVGWTEGGEPALRALPCYNGGVLAARPRAWRRLRLAYEKRAAAFYTQSGHRSRCQWLLNWCFREAGLAVDVLPGSFHSHGHFGRPAGVTLDAAGVAHWGGLPVLFRHAF